MILSQRLGEVLRWIQRALGQNPPMSTDDTDRVELPEELDWMIDVPLFIDRCRIEELHDVVSQPIEDPYTVQPENIDRRDAETTEREEGIEAGISANIPSLFDIRMGASERVLDSQTIEEATHFSLATTPPRQLAQVALRYLVSDEEFLYTDTDLAEDDWIKSSGASESEARSGGPEGTGRSTGPRPLVFLELPSRDEVDTDVDTEGRSIEELRDIPVETKLVPTAAEFEDGTVEPIYRKLESLQEEPPSYPELGDEYQFNDEKEPVVLTKDNIGEARREYWRWFQENFVAKEAARAVEDAARENGDIRWIDYRLPRNLAGDTLHLHIQGREEYNTGTFAYNFIKRGFKHGVRMVGTIKSEPDMDVLAIYER